MAGDDMEFFKDEPAFTGRGAASPPIAKTAAPVAPAAAPAAAPVAAPVQSGGGSGEMEFFKDEPEFTGKGAAAPPIARNAAPPVQTAEASKPAEGEHPGQLVKNWDNTPQGTAEAPMPVTTMLKGAAKNLIPSAINDVAAVAHAIRHPIDTGNALADLGKGYYSKLEGMVSDQPQDPVEKAKTEAAANAMNAQLANTFGSWEGFKKSFKDDPAGWIANVVPAVGAVGKAGKVLSGAGDAASVAKAAELAKAAQVAKTISHPVSDAMIKGGTEGLSSASTIPKAAHSVMADVFDAKGRSIPAAKEGTIKYTAGIDAPRNVILGKAPAPGTEGAVAAEIARGNANIDKKMVELAGGQSPDVGSLIRPIETQYIKDANGVADSYYNAFHPQNIPAGPPSAANTFDPSLKLSMGRHMTNAIKSIGEGGVNSLDDLRTASSLPRAGEAASWLKSRMEALPQNQMTLPVMEQIRKDLGSYYKGAVGSDYNAVGKIIDGFDKALQEGAGHAKSFGGNGQEIVDNMIKAREAYKVHRNTYFNKKDPAYKPVANALKTMTEDYEKDAAGRILGPASEGHAQIAEDAISKALMHPTTGNAVHSALMDLHGAQGPGMQSVNDYIRRSILGSRQDPSGVGTIMAKDPVKLHEALHSPIASKAFTPEELAEARFLNVGRRMLNAQPKVKGTVSNPFWHTLGSTAGRMGLAGIGHLLGSYPGAFAGWMMEPQIEKVLRSISASHALSGAKPVVGKGRIARTAKALAKAPVTVPKALLQPRYLDPALAVQGREGHASGGKVGGHQHLVDQLFHHVERAKKMEKGRTSVLLQHPDEHIAKALNVAQAAI